MCNPNNLLLTLDPNDEINCYIFENDTHAHGGYQCAQNGTWSDVCVPYYCDIGYIFDTNKKICIKDICTEEGEEEEEEEEKKEKEKEKDKKENEPEEPESFPVYAIVLISVAGVIIIAVVIIIIYKFVISNKVKNNEIEGPLSEGNRDGDVELNEKN